MKRTFLAATLGITSLLAGTETAQAQLFFERGSQGGPSFGPGLLPPPPRLSLGLGGPFFRSADGFYGPSPIPMLPGLPDLGGPFFRPGFATPAFYDSSAGYAIWGPTYVGAARDGVFRSFYQPPAEGVERAMIRILVPTANAQISFDGTATEQQGVERAFVSPAIEGRADHTYSVRASWTQDGRESTREAQVKVRAGHETTLSFLADSGVRRVRFDQPRSQEVQAGMMMSGRVVSTTDGQLIMTELRGNRRHTPRLSPEARVFIDGKEATVADLKEGMRIEVTTKEGQPDLATRIEARTSDPPRVRDRFLPLPPVLPRP